MLHLQHFTFFAIMPLDEARCIQIMIESGGLNMEGQFDLNAFTWFYPEPKSKWIVNIPIGNA